MRYRVLFANILLFACVWASVRHAAPETAATAEPQSSWGIPYKGVAVWVEVKHPAGPAGIPFEITLHTRNVGRTTVQTRRVSPFSDYRILLFGADGDPVPVPKEVLAAQERARTAVRQGIIYRCIIDDLRPGQDVGETFRLAEWFGATRPGTYTLLVMRQVGPWAQGFAVANPVQLTLTK